MDETRGEAGGGSVAAVPSLPLPEQKLVDETSEPTPPVRLPFKTSETALRDVVVLGLAVVLGTLPRALDPAFLLQTRERRIESPLVQPERRLRQLLESGRQR